MSEIKLPPIKTNKDGEQRRVGFELEYSGIDLPTSARLLADQYGGEIVPESNSSYRVNNTRFGKFTVMLDMSGMQKLSAEVAAEAKANPDNPSLKSKLEKVLHPIVSTWMPNEIVTPPIPLDQLDKLDRMSAIFREHGAKGTRASSVYAFGMHINAELPEIPLERLRDYIAAFILLQERLQIQGDTDVTRQLSRFAKLFPEGYAELILQPDYKPGIEQLMDDYLRYNPTRNRGLDMLPAFCSIDEARVRAAIKDELVRPRPTFHYRLPNCDIDNPDWSILDEWNLWLMVEELAEDEARLDAMARAYLA